MLNKFIGSGGALENLAVAYRRVAQIEVPACGATAGKQQPQSLFADKIFCASEMVSMNLIHAG